MSNIKNFQPGSNSSGNELKNSISLLVNQNEQISNILSEFHSKGKLQGRILDFTIRHFRYLYLLYAKSIVVLDFKDLLSSKMNSSASDLQIVDSIQLDRANIGQLQKQVTNKASDQSKGPTAQSNLSNQKQSSTTQSSLSVQNNQSIFTCIEVANDRDQSLLLFSDIASKRQPHLIQGETVPAKSTGDDVTESTVADSATTVSSSRQGADKQSSGHCEILHIDCSRLKGGKAGSSSFSSNDRYIQGYSSQSTTQNNEAYDKSQQQHVLTYLQYSTQSEQFPKGKLLDIEIWDNYLALLFEKNLVVVYNLKRNKDSKKDAGQQQSIQFNKPIFKAHFADASDQITQLFFIKDFQQSSEDDASDSDDSQKLKQGDTSDDSDQAKYASKSAQKQFEGNQQSRTGQSSSAKKLQGHFLMVETKQPLLSKSTPQNEIKQALKKTFRKLHIVQIQDNIGPLYLKEKPGQSSNQNIKSSQQQLSQLAQLTIKETQSKFVQYDPIRGIVFMMNQEKSDRHLRLFSVKLKKELVDDSDSDERTQQTNSSMYKFRFEYITEVRLQISNQSFSTLQNAIHNQPNKGQDPQLQSSPMYLQVLHSGFEQSQLQQEGSGKMSSIENEKYYIYTNIMDQVLVFQRSMVDLTPTSMQLVKVLSGVKEPQNKSIKTFDGSGPTNFLNDISKFGQMPDSYKEEILRKSKEMMDNPDYGNTETKNKDKPKEDKAGKTDDKEAEELSQEENEAIAAYKKNIEQECDEEARRDEKMLQQTLDEALKDIMSEDENKQDKKKNLEEAYDFGLIDLGFEGEDQLAAANKTNALDDENAAIEIEIDQEDGEEKLQPAQQNLSKKERKAQKKLEKKSKNQKKDQQSDEQIQQQSSKTETVAKSNQLQATSQTLEKDKQTSQQSISAQNALVLASNQTGKKKLQKVQEQQIVENLSELTRKYQELAQKTNQLQQLLSRQQQQKQEVDTTIKKAVKEGLGEKIIGQQVRDLVIPLLTKKIKSMDEQVSEVILPKIEAQVEAIFKKMIDKENVLKQPGSSQQMPKPQEIQQLIQKEFRQALQGIILPNLEQQIKQTLVGLDKKLQQVDVALCEKLAEEEQRWKQMEKQYENSLHWLKLFHKKVGQMAQEMIAQQMNEQAQHEQRIVYEQMERDILTKLQAQMQQSIQIQVQQKVQEYIQFQVPQIVQMQLQQSNLQSFQPQPTKPPISLYSMNLAPPTLETQLSQTSSTNQPIQATSIYGIASQPSTTLAPQRQASFITAKSFNDPVVISPAHASNQPQPAMSGLSNDFINQYKQLKSQMSSIKSDTSQRDHDIRLKFKLAEIDQETENFRNQMHLLQRQLRFGVPDATVDEHGQFEENAEILKNFELQQEAKKKKLIEKTKSIKSDNNEIAGPPQIIQSKSEKERNNEEKLNSFLLSKQQVQSRTLQATNLTSKQKKTKDKAEDDIFKELDNECADDFLGQELGYRGQQDSEHEDSEGIDDADIKSDDADLKTNEYGEESERANQYLADSRTLRPYDDDSDQEKTDFGGSGKHGQTYDSSNQRASGSNRGALKFLAANAGMRGGNQKERKHSKRNRAHSRNDDYVDSNSSQGYQSREVQKMRYDRPHPRDKHQRDDLGRRKNDVTSKQFGGGSGAQGQHRQLTSWKDTFKQ